MCLSQMMELKESIMINLYMYLKSFLKNVNNFSQHQHFWSSKEMNMEELKSFPFSIMLWEKSTFSRLEFKFHCMMLQVTDVLERKILKIIFLNWCPHFRNLKSYKKLFIHFMWLQLSENSFSIWIQKELGRSWLKTCLLVLF